MQIFDLMSNDYSIIVEVDEVESKLFQLGTVRVHYLKLSYNRYDYDVFSLHAYT